MTKINDLYGTAEAVPFQNRALERIFPQPVKPCPFKSTCALLAWRATTVRSRSCGGQPFHIRSHDHQPQHDRHLSEKCWERDLRDQVTVLRCQQVREAHGHVGEAVE